MCNHPKKIKAEVREKQARKKETKQKKGGTLSGQVSRMQTMKNYEGSVKKMKKAL